MPGSLLDKAEKKDNRDLKYLADLAIGDNGLMSHRSKSGQE